MDQPHNPGNLVPRGLEVLVKKAAVDAEFKQLLLAKREAAAEAIGLELTPAEAHMIRSVSAGQLEGIITRTNVPEEQRRAFLGQAAAAMLAALGILSGCGEQRTQTFGHVADRIPGNEPKDNPKPPPPKEKVTGSRPDRPEPGKSP